MVNKSTNKRSRKPTEAQTVQTEAVVQIKSIFLSKTFWVNVIALVALQAQKHYGFVIDETMQIEILGLVNIALRSITSDAVTWRKNRGNTQKDS